MRNGSHKIQMELLNLHLDTTSLQCLYRVCYLTSDNIQEVFLNIHLAGLFSGLVSHVVAARIHFPRIVNHLSSTVKNASNTSSRRFFSAPRPPNDILPSLGASGGVYALVTMTALAYKDAEVSMFFLPLSIPIQWGVGGMVALDVLGILRGWR